MEFKKFHRLSVNFTVFTKHLRIETRKCLQCTLNGICIWGNISVLLMKIVVTVNNSKFYFIFFSAWLRFMEVLHFLWIKIVSRCIKITCHLPLTEFGLHAIISSVLLFFSIFWSNNHSGECAAISLTLVTDHLTHVWREDWTPIRFSLIHAIFKKFS